MRDDRRRQAGSEIQIAAVDLILDTALLQASTLSTTGSFTLEQKARAVMKLQSLPIDKVYVPVKRRKDLKPGVVQIAESMLEIGQQSPILVRLDGDRFILVEGLHRLEACKALGETTINGVLVTADTGLQQMPENPEADAEREKMKRLKALRLEKEAAEALATAASTQKVGAESTRLPRERLAKPHMTNNSKAPPKNVNRVASRSTPATLSEWIAQQKRDGGRY